MKPSTITKLRACACGCDASVRVTLSERNVAVLKEPSSDVHSQSGLLGIAD